MITIFNHLFVKEGAAGQIVERFANNWGTCRGSRASSRCRSCAPTISCSREQ